MAGQASIWATLLPVIIGGAIGVSGSVFGSWFIEKRKEKSERKRHREKKNEEAVTAVYEFDHRLEKYRLDTAVGKEQQMTSSPFAKLEGIVALHFPELGIDARQRCKGTPTLFGAGGQKKALKQIRQQKQLVNVAPGPEKCCFTWPILAAMPRPSGFIAPCLPSKVDRPPTGPLWVPTK